MPDPIAAQNLCDALKTFIGTPTTHTPYSVAKDFQTLVAGILALMAASIGSFIAYRSAGLAYRGVMERIEFDRKTVELDRKTAERDRQRLKYGAFLRLRSQTTRLKQAASQKAREIELSLKIAEGKADEVEWKDEFGFDDFDELEKAWKKIDLFPMGAIHFIDSLRSTLARTRENMAHCLTDRNEDGNIPFVLARIYRDNCTDIERRAILLVDSLDVPIRELAKIDWPQKKGDQ